MWCLQIRIKRNDELHGKRLEQSLLNFLINAGVSGATVWTGVDGFGKRGRSTTKIEGITINLPMVIEIIDTREKLEPILPSIKRMVDDNGLVTLHEVDVI
jgi:PII-like signaling protein